jgi:hypothetical protein
MISCSLARFDSFEKAPWEKEEGKGRGSRRLAMMKRCSTVGLMGMRGPTCSPLLTMPTVTRRFLYEKPRSAEGSPHAYGLGMDGLPGIKDMPPKAPLSQSIVDEQQSATLEFRFRRAGIAPFVFIIWYGARLVLDPYEEGTRYTRYRKDDIVRENPMNAEMTPVINHERFDRAELERLDRQLATSKR